MAPFQPTGASLITPELESFVNAHWTDQMGAIDGHDIQFIAALLAEAEPKTLVEIGCASGLSTAAIALLMGQRGPCHIHSFDLATRFYGDPTKPLGYLLSQIEQPQGVGVTLNPEKTSLDVGAVLGETAIDFCFIDARHAHPWPILDTLAVLPHMRPGAFIVHHDLRMYQDDRPDIYASGPKIALDQTPADLRVWFASRVYGQSQTKMKARGFGGGNIFALKVPDAIEDLAGNIAQGLYLPWDPLPETYIEPEFAAKFRQYFAQAYPPYIVKAFDCGLARYNDRARKSRGTWGRRVARKLGLGV